MSNLTSDPVNEGPPRGNLRKPASIYDDLRYLYAPQLKGKRVTLTIRAYVPDVKFVSADGRTSTGFDLEFEGTPKALGVTAMTVRHQLVAATGTDDPALMPGKKITLYAVPSKRSASGLAIRIAPPEGAPP
jgi:hypothetical protein